jgi:hypothetical protein
MRIFPLVFALACSAQIGGPEAGAGAGTGTGGGAGSSSGGGGNVMGDSDACPTREVPRTPLRRLTRFEYANSVRDLLNVDPAPARDLPADEVTNSFDNNAAVLTVSSLHAEKYVLVAETLAKQAVQNLSGLANCDAAVNGEEACARAFAQSFGRRAFRRAVTPQDEQFFMTAYAAGRIGGSHAEGIEVMIRAALQSPSFLYRLETTTPGDATAPLVPLSQFELATRLSYLLWASGPDDALLDAAARGELATREQVATRARQMLGDAKARVAMENFFEQWTSTRRLEILTKNTTLFPAYSTAVRDAMAKELPAFVNDVLWNGDHNLTTLLTAPVAFVTAPLAPLYGVAPPPGSETNPVRVDLPADQGRSGILTQAGFLSVQAHPDQTSPVLRGKFVRAMLLCQPPEPPPPDVDVSLPTIDEGATARQRFSAHLTAGTTCNGCHRLMDPIGLAFENFDAMGQSRQLDNGQPIDVSGEIMLATDMGLNGTFSGVRELGQKLAASEQVRDCVAMQLFRFASGRSEGAADACSLGTMQDAFDQSDGDILELVVAMTQTDAFWYRSVVTP